MTSTTKQMRPNRKGEGLLRCWQCYVTMVRGKKRICQQLISSLIPITMWNVTPVSIFRKYRWYNSLMWTDIWQWWEILIFFCGGNKWGWYERLQGVVGIWTTLCSNALYTIYLLPHVAVPLLPVFLNLMLLKNLVVSRPQLDLHLIPWCTIESAGYPTQQSPNLNHTHSKSLVVLWFLN